MFYDAQIEDEKDRVCDVLDYVFGSKFTFVDEEPKMRRNNTRQNQRLSPQEPVKLKSF